MMYGDNIPEQPLSPPEYYCPDCGQQVASRGRCEECEGEYDEELDRQVREEWEERR